MPINNTTIKTTPNFSKKHGSWFYTLPQNDFYKWAIHPQWQDFGQPYLFIIYEMAKNNDGNYYPTLRHTASDLKSAKQYITKIEMGA